MDPQDAEPKPPGRGRARLTSLLGGHSRGEMVLFVCVALLLLGFVGPPILFLLKASVSEWDGFRATGEFSFESFRELFDDGFPLTLLANTLVFSAGSSLVALAFGTTFAWLVARTNIPLKGIIYATMFISFAIPGIVKVIGWILLLGPRAGWLNQLFVGAGLEGGLLNLFSMTGMIVVEGMLWTPIIFLLMVVPFSTMDPSLEEAARVTGATTWQIFRRITLPLAWPSVLACLILSFIRAVESFEIPALLGLPAGVRVFTTEIYEQLTGGTFPDYGIASAYAVILIALVLGLMVVYTRQTSKGNKYNTIRGRGFKPALLDLGRARVPAGIAAALAALILMLPLLGLGWASLLPFYQAPSLDALASVSFENYATVTNSRSLGRATVNTLVIAVTAATVATLITMLAAWLVVRSRIRGRKALDFLITLPVILPGIIAGVAVLRTFIDIPVGIYGTLWILVYAYVMRALPYAMRYNHPGLLQLHAELEESAEVSGASLATRMRRIVIPLMIPALSASFLYVFLVSVKELAMALLLYGPGTEVISVAIFDLYQNGQVTELAAFCVIVAASVTALAMGFLALARRYGISVK